MCCGEVGRLGVGMGVCVGRWVGVWAFLRRWGAVGNGSRYSMYLIHSDSVTMYLALMRFKVQSKVSL